jgi:glucose-6-phosphate 1-epimerase
MSQSNDDAAALDRRFAIPGVAHVESDPAGHPVVRIATEKCLGAIHLHGAQVTSWKPASTTEVIFSSSKATFTEGQAIRGGIPICFPWFRAKSDNANAPAHGFVRTKLWMLDSIQNGSEGVLVILSTASDTTTKQWWPHDFRAQLSATFGNKLVLEFTVTNTGAAPFRFEEALHTYHAVGDIRSARVRGLDGAAYLDNTDANREKKQTGELAILRATDSAYLGSEQAIVLLDPPINRKIHITKQNSKSTVIWNPWEEAANKMSDLGDGEWQKFLCAEAANILANAIELHAGEKHTLTATISASPV